MGGKKGTEKAIVNARLWRINTPNSKMDMLSRRRNDNPKKARWRRRTNYFGNRRKAMEAAGG